MWKLSASTSTTSWTVVMETSSFPSLVHVHCILPLSGCNQSRYNFTIENFKCIFDSFGLRLLGKLLMKVWGWQAIGWYLVDKLLVPSLPIRTFPSRRSTYTEPAEGRPGNLGLVAIFLKQLIGGRYTDTWQYADNRLGWLDHQRPPVIDRPVPELVVQLLET